LRKYYAEYGKAMPPADVARLFTDSDWSGEPAASAKEVYRTWRETMINAPIKFSDLKRIFDAKRRSVETLHVKFRETTHISRENCKDVFRPPDDPRRDDCLTIIEFAQSGAKMVNSSSEAFGVSPAADQFSKPEWCVYDGQSAMYYIPSANRAWRDDLAALNPRLRGVESDWLAIGGLLGDLASGTTGLLYLDMCSMIEKLGNTAYVDAALRTQGGTTVATVSFGVPPHTTVLLDIDHVFSPIMIESVAKIGVEKVPVTVRYTCENLQDTGNGLWLPGKVTMEYLRPVSDNHLVVYLSKVYEAEVLTVNQPIPEEWFDVRKLLPVDNSVIVEDRLLGLEYRVGIDESAVVRDIGASIDQGMMSLGVTPVGEVPVQEREAPLTRLSSETTRDERNSLGILQVGPTVVTVVLVIVAVAAVVIVVVRLCCRGSVTQKT
jgi:hypothetical protein